MNKSGKLKIPEDKVLTEKIRQNWLCLKELNIKKAHLICSDDYSIPENKDSVNQRTIFDKQIAKYVIPNHEVAVLNAFPLFWFEYVDEQKIIRENKGKYGKISPNFVNMHKILKILCIS